MKRAALYARYSSDIQNDRSIEDQLRLCRARCKAEGWQVVDTYIDCATSGASLIRPGIQDLMSDMQNGSFDIVVSESFDKISRDQEDIAHIYKRMQFRSIPLINLSEGEVSELHVGLKGTMGALYLKDLADKTRRGQLGRVEAGKSGGGKCFGYNVVSRLDERGLPIRGEREINEDQARVVLRILEDYAAGMSPKAIARQLNQEGVRGPSGRGWTQSTINGNRDRGTGILNNEIYVGKLVWNRQRYIKDPDTGKRVSRLNPREEWVTQDVPDLRIAPDDLWAKVKERQGAYSGPKDKFQRAKRPTFLLSGLMKCGSCGGGFSMVSRTHYGCSTARNKGTCENRRTIAKKTVETAVLEALQSRLMDEDSCKVFCDEYTKHVNRCRMEQNAQLDAYKQELRKNDSEQERIIDAICAGIAPEKVKERMNALDARQQELKKILASMDEAPVLLHPNMARRYREEVSALIETMEDSARRFEASVILRGLIEKIVLSPSSDGSKLEIDLVGDLAGILSIAHGDEKGQSPNKSSGSPCDIRLPELSQVQLVAGGRSQRCQQLLFQAAA